MHIHKDVALLCCALAIPFSANAFTTSGNTYATDGSAADTAAALNSVPDGATVMLPDGNYSWGSQVVIHNYVHVVAQHFGKVTIARTYTAGDMLVVNASTAGNVELAGINFTSNLAGSKDNYSFTVLVNQLGGLPVLIHDCTFVTGYEYAIVWTGNGGVVWNCSFHTHSDILGGISFVNASPTDFYWNQPDALGMAGDPAGTSNTYVEDCQFYDASSTMCNIDDNSRVVWRHNLMSNCAWESHGQETSRWGCRHWEIYNNTFIRSTSGTAFGGDPYPLNLNRWIQIRGGTGVVTQNQMDDIPSDKTGVQLNVFSINRIDQIPCQTAYPAAHQVGQGWSSTSTQPFGNPVVSRDGIGAILDPIYIWNNTGAETSDVNYVGLNQYSPDECHNGEDIAVFVQQNRDYFVNVAKPAWTPFTYPHPLRNGLSPTPTPVRSPTSAANYQSWISGLLAYLNSQGDWSSKDLSTMTNILNQDQPWLDRQNSYWIWRGEIDSYMRSDGLSNTQTNEFDTYFRAKPNP